MPDPVVKTRIANLAEVKKPAAEGRLYAILDACDAPVIYAKVREMDESQAVCLYRGKLDPEVLAEAPYLVRMPTELLDWLQKTVWKTPWGIFVVANTDLRSLRKHLRRLLIVADDDGDAVYFRYYDPRMLSIYLPTCTDEELRVFLGPVLAYGVGDPKVDSVTYFLREEPNAVADRLAPGAILRMRPDQMSAFDRAAKERFVNRLLSNVRRQFPEPLAKRDEQQVRARIHRGIMKAEKYGLESEHDIRRYVYLLFAFGDDFDVNPESPWAHLILTDESTEPGEKISLLYDSAPPHPVIGKGKSRDRQTQDVPV